MGAIDVVEAAYELTADPQEWLSGIARTAGPLLDGGHGSFALTVESIAHPNVVLGEMIVCDCSPELVEFVHTSTSTLSAVDHGTTYGSPAVFDSMSARAGHLYSSDHWMFKAFRERFGVEDFDLVRAVDPAGFACFLAAGRSTVHAPNRRAKTRWGRLAAHILAGLRIHRRMRHEPASVPPIDREPVEAVMEPTGKLLHAKGPATKSEARAELRSAALAIDHARGAAKARDDEHALNAWQALVAGRWSLVDVFDSDGRRLVIARENRPEAEALVNLTKREREVVSYVRLGWANKMIAYTLGLRESTVSEHLTRAMEKIGARSRGEVLRAIARKARG